MCVSNNFIEQQAYKISEEIRKNSLYKVIRLDVSGVSSLGIQKQDDQWNGKDFITKVILEDTRGNYYSVKPDYNGLRFAKGEINYKEYSKLQKKEDLKGLSYFFGITGILIIMMVTFMRFLV